MGYGAVPGLRERKKLATRQELARAALRLAMERGLDNVLVEDIAAAADVSPRTFNNYFANKYEAICSLGVERAALIGDALRQRPAEEPLWEALANAVVGHYEQGPLRDGPTIASLRMVMCSPQLRGEQHRTLGAMREALASAIAERTAMSGAGAAGSVPGREGSAPAAYEGLGAEVLAAAVLAAAHVAVRRWAAADPPVDLGQLIGTALAELAGTLRGA